MTIVIEQRAVPEVGDGIIDMILRLAEEQGDDVVHAFVAQVLSELALGSHDPDAAIEAFGRRLTAALPVVLADAVSRNDRLEQARERQTESRVAQCATARGSDQQVARSKTGSLERRGAKGESQQPRRRYVQSGANRVEADNKEFR
jgi:hypothetical protein